MNPSEIIITAFSSIIAFAVTIYTRPVKKIAKYPKAGDPLENYNADFIIISYALNTARTKWELNYARKEIYRFKSDYLSHQDPITLNQDIRKLRDKYKAQRLVISISKVPMVK